jgi:ADP-ribose pyrophosphatase YjhB (NUDIX family)
MFSIKPIRSAARALIIKDGHLLVIRMEDDRGMFLILPGGGQRPGETLHEALRRECFEEIGVKIEIGSIAYVREYIGRNHDFKAGHRSFHQIEMVFYCSIPRAEVVQPGHEMDRHQIGIEWLPLSSLASAPLYPEAIKPFFADGGFVCPTLYLGDIN